MNRCTTALKLIEKATLVFARVAPLLLLVGSTAWSQGYVISTVGGGVAPATPVVGTAAYIGASNGVATDSSGNVYVSATNLHCVFKLDTSGNLTLYAGTCRPGYSGDGGAATSAQLDAPHGLAVDTAGNLYIADTANNAVRKVSPGGLIATVAGTGAGSFCGDGSLAINACVYQPLSVALDSAGDLYIADYGNARIREVAASTGIITTVAGGATNLYDGDGGAATAVQLDGPEGVALDPNGNIFIAETLNQKIRKVSLNGTITTVAGNGSSGSTGDGGPAISAELQGPTAVVADSTGDFYIADLDNSRVRMVSNSGTITTFAGNGSSTGTGDTGNGGPATSATVAFPSALAIDSTGRLIIAEQWLPGSIRRVAIGGVITSIAGGGAVPPGDGGPAVNAQLYGMISIASDAAGNLYVIVGGEIRKISTGGTITTVAAAANASGFGLLNASGNLYFTELCQIGEQSSGDLFTIVAGIVACGYAGDTMQATSAELNRPQAIAADGVGNLYITDTYNSRVRKISPSGIITTVAGTGTPGFSGDSGPATGAQLSFPYGLAVDSNGNLYIADTGNSRIRKVDLTGNITTIANQSTFSLALDSNDNLYFANQLNHVVYKYSAGAGVVQIAGTGTAGYSGDGGPALDAQLDAPSQIAVDGLGRVYFIDQIANAVRMLQIPQGLSITLNHTGSFTAGQIGATYTVTVLNLTAAVSASGTVTVTDTLPSGFTLTGMTGSGWNCASNTCTRSDVLPAGSSYPPISVTVNVAANASSPSVNMASVTGGGVSGASATDSTIVLAAPASGQAPAASLPATCQVTNGAAVPTVRAEGLAERMGDVVLLCTGGTPAGAGFSLRQVNITVTLNTNLTNRVMDGTGASDVILTVDEPGSPESGAPAAQLACATPLTGCSIMTDGLEPYDGTAGRPNVFEGVITGNNAVTFYGVPLTGPGSYGINGSRVLRITNIRADSAAFWNAVAAANSSNGLLPVLQTTVSIESTPAIAITTPTYTNGQFGAGTAIPTQGSLLVGFTNFGLTYQTWNAANTAIASGPVSLSGCGTGSPCSVAVARFTENFATATLTRTVAVQQNIPGSFFNSESGFFNTALASSNSNFATAGLADAGTRLKATFQGVPAGAQLWVGLNTIGSTPGFPAVLTAQEAGALNPVATGASINGAPAAQLTVTNGSAAAVWEVTAENPSAIDSYSFPVWVTFPNGSTPAGTLTIQGSFAPNADAGAFALAGEEMAQTAAYPLPRFTSSAPPTLVLSGSPCDLKETGSITVADVQLIINEALGVAPAVNHLSGGDSVNVVDVQIEINAALGLGCSAQ